MREEFCKHTVYTNTRYGSFHGHQCTRKAVKDGWCNLHHPKAIEKRQKEKEERQNKAFDNSLLGQAYKRIRKLEAEVIHLQKCLNKQGTR